MLFFYKILTVALYPFLIVLILFRRFLGKEDWDRFKEKIFFQKKEINANKLIWFHAASIGEINRIYCQPLIEGIEIKNIPIHNMISPK